MKKKASRACRHRGRCCALPWPTSARNENHNSDSKVPLWGLITAVTGRGYSHPELPQMLLFNQEWMNIVWDVLLIQCLAERHFDWLFDAGFKYSTHRRWFLLKVCSILVLKPNYFPFVSFIPKWETQSKIWPFLMIRYWILRLQTSLAFVCFVGWWVKIERNLYASLSPKFLCCTSPSSLKFDPT